MRRGSIARFNLLLGLVAVALTVQTAGAGAATVGAGKFQGELVLEAGPGEVNEIELTGSGNHLVVRDAGAPLDPGQGCSGQVDGSVRCDMGDVYLVQAQLGDGGDDLETSGRIPAQLSADLGPGDDTAAIAGVEDICLDGGDGDDVLSTEVATRSCSLDGGPGSDSLTGSGGQDRLYGGLDEDVLDAEGGPDYIEGDEGDDTIEGGSGPDIFLTGGDGDDTVDSGPGNDFMEDGPGEDSYLGGTGDDALAVLISAGIASDRFDGGEGHDAYLRICGSCQIHLGTGRNGRRGTAERDFLLNVEDAAIRSRIPNDEEFPAETYGSGADVVVGNSVANTLRTERGPDRLAGGAGRDRLRAGPGDDLVRSADGVRDSLVECGQGDDRAIVDPLDDPVGCEHVIVRH